MGGGGVRKKGLGGKGRGLDGRGLWLRLKRRCQVR